MNVVLIRIIIKKNVISIALKSELDQF